MPAVIQPIPGYLPRRRQFVGNAVNFPTSLAFSTSNPGFSQPRFINNWKNDYLSICPACSVCDAQAPQRGAIPPCRYFTLRRFGRCS